MLGGFAPHVDSTAYTHIKDIKHLAILLAVDPSNSTNGGLEVVEGSHEMNVPVGKDNCTEPDWVRQQKWTPVELEAGEITQWKFRPALTRGLQARSSFSDRIWLIVVAPTIAMSIEKRCMLHTTVLGKATYMINTMLIGRSSGPQRS
jgi:hypothetical protein